MGRGTSVRTSPNSRTTNTQTGVSYPFVITTTPITSADLQNLPGGSIMQGATYHQLMPYTMRLWDINSLRDRHRLHPGGRMAF